MTISLHKLLEKNKIPLDTLVVTDHALEIRVGILKYETFVGSWSQFFFLIQKVNIMEMNKNYVKLM